MIDILSILEQNSKATPEEIAVAIVGEMIRHRREQSSEKNTRANPVDSKRDGADEAP